MSFFEHLGELRQRIIYSLIFIVVFFIASWGFVQKLYYWLSLPVLQFLPAGATGEKKLAFTALTEPFMMYIKVALIAALFLASPFVFHQLWLFIRPALFPKEKKWVVPFVFFTSFFFILGGLFGYFVVFPFACRFFLSMGKDFPAIITINEYFSLAFRILFGIALVFELPVLVFLLAKLRMVSARFLLQYFKICRGADLHHRRRDHAHARHGHPNDIRRAHDPALRHRHHYCRRGRIPARKRALTSNSRYLFFG